MESRSTAAGSEVTPWVVPAIPLDAPFLYTAEVV